MNWVLVPFLIGCWCISAQCKTTTSDDQNKRGWPIKLCFANDHCDGGCCKGFVCFRYLKEGEKCLFGHRLKVGCGCEKTLECEKQKYPWKHTCVKKLTPMEEFDRELDVILEKKKSEEDKETKEDRDVGEKEERKEDHDLSTEEKKENLDLGKEEEEEKKKEKKSTDDTKEETTKETKENA